MGAQPTTALNIVGFPDDQLELSILVEILRGGAEQVRRADAVLVGGHTVRDQEIKYGLSVTGVVAPEQLITNREAKPGDQLLLTKPLGTGYITTAAKAGQCPTEVLQVAVDGMCRLNRTASEAAVAAGIRAMTDVTGFGLAGHAMELAVASGATIVLDVSHTPAYPSAIELGSEGYRTRANKSNRAFTEPQMRIDGNPDPERVELCFDAQTSGGLLIAAPPNLVDAVVRFIVDRGEPAPVHVGEVVPQEDRRLVLR
jgi:selenide,water dikinase